VTGFLPKGTDLDKGYYQRCVIWNIGAKNIEVQVGCTGVDYFLNLEVYKPEIKEIIKKEKEQKEQEALQKGVDLL
jgi:hypothetical protein